MRPGKGTSKPRVNSSPQQRFLLAIALLRFIQRPREKNAICVLLPLPTNSQPFELKGISPFHETCQVELFTGVREKSYSPFISLNPIPFLLRTSLYSSKPYDLIFPPSQNISKNLKSSSRMQIE